MCSNCQAFNHSTGSCKPNSIKCGKCSEAHPAASCSSSSIVCTNCEQNHIASDPNYPKRLKEIKLMKVKCFNHLPCTEARRQYKSAASKSTS
ncbi:hypothetical protein AVEN_154915-1 [Araneus ventricosus]|uniref:Uncharacterized protein n=1 Tax=Araneus ventricosus TaxID=182803 RepID=A0A4Y2A9I9_ARAVE|nr:hypothetical protein AVEN_154915-1 [Araneus ventricosus]